MGYDYNVFLSPKEFETNDEILGPDSLIQNGAFNNFNGYIKYSRVSKDKKSWFNSSVDGFTKNYFNSDLNEFYNLNYFLNSSYKFKYQKYSWIQASVKTGRERLVRSTIIGDEYTRPYSYYQFYPKMTVQQRVAKNLWLNAWAGYDSRKYDGRDSIAQFQSFSYNSVNLGAKLSYRHRLFGNLMSYEASWTRRDRHYTEWLVDEVFDEFGEEITLDSLVSLDPEYQYPLNNWLYNIYNFKFSYDIGKNISLNGYYGVSLKQNIGQSDLGFTTPNYGGSISYKKGKLFLKYDYKWSSRNYTNRLAYTYDDEEPEFLYYRFTNHKFYTSYGLSNGWRLNLTLSTENRFTNSTDISKKFRRSYFTYSSMLGASYSFNKKFKKKLSLNRVKK